MLQVVIIAGFFLGFLGSMHCVGMCGPIVLALPFKSASNYRFVVKRVFYHLGRIAVYGLLGFLLGLLSGKINLTGFQHAITILTGAALLVFGVLSLMKFEVLSRIKFVEKPYIFMRKLLGRFVLGDGLFSGFLLGVLNGFLPCGFVYVALAGAFVYSDILLSSLFMVFFGLGTIPALIAVSILPRLLKKKISFSSHRLIPVITIVFAIIFILRGLNLGIPYISPDITNKTTFKKEMPQKKVEVSKEERKDCCE